MVQTMRDRKRTGHYADATRYVEANVCGEACLKTVHVATEGLVVLTDITPDRCEVNGGFPPEQHVDTVGEAQSSNPDNI